MHPLNFCYSDKNWEIWRDESQSEWKCFSLSNSKVFGEDQKENNDEMAEQIKDRKEVI